MFERPTSEEISLTHHSETEQTQQISVAFLFRCKNVAGLAEKLEEITKQGRLDTVMLDEYDLAIEDVNANANKISEMAQSKMVDIILAADNANHNGEEGYKQVPWNIRREQIKDAGVTVLDEGIVPEEVMDSVGYYFGKDGSKYAFPKTWKHPVHQIPNTRVAVAVCGEIGYAKPEDIERLSANKIYNPSREHDDPQLKWRMVGLHNPNITDEELLSELKKDDLFRNSYEGKYRNLKADYSHLDPEMRTIMEETDDYLDTNQPTPQELKQRAQEWFDQTKGIIQNELMNPSMYVKSINETLTRKNITVIRSDGESNSGILNPSSKTKIQDLGYKESYARMTIIIN